MQTQTDLNDLRWVAAIAQVGTLAGAARRLGVSAATVLRRLEAAEAALGARLFDRSGGRYVPTLAGDELARAGAAIEQTAGEALRRVAGQDLQPSGTVRIATTESVACHLLGPLLGALREALPTIHLHIVAVHDFQMLSRRDADIALRPAPNPPEHLIGTRIGPLGSAVYAARGKARAFSRGTLAEHPWIALDDVAGRTTSLRWLAGLLPLDQVPLRFSTLIGVHQACLHGLGLAVLPCFVGDSDTRLARVTDPLSDCASELWLLTHAELQSTARVKAVYEWLLQALAAAASQLAGH